MREDWLSSGQMLFNNIALGFNLHGVSDLMNIFITIIS